MQRIGQIWKNTGHIVDLPIAPKPITDINMAINRRCDSSWADDMNLMDFANDDNFATCWVSSPEINNPWWLVELDKTAQVSMVVITEGHNSRLSEYTIEISKDGVWKQVDNQSSTSSIRSRVHISRFSPIEADAVRVRFKAQENTLSIAEIGVYGE